MKTRTYQYPSFQKIVNNLFFIMFMIAAFFVLLLILIGTFQAKSTPENSPPFLVGLLAPCSFVFIAFMVNIMTPEIEVRDDGFRLKALLYRSHWLKWQEIKFIEEPLLSNRRYKIQGVGIDRISSLYSIIGVTQGLGGRSFLITEKIEGYADLLGLFEEHRPDIFAINTD